MKGAETAENGGGGCCAERENHTADRNPERKLSSAEARAGRCCQTRVQTGVAGSTSEGKMKVATRRFSALLALSKVLTEGPHGLGGKGERKG